jgi:hypothetical protein
VRSMALDLSNASLLIGASAFLTTGFVKGV